MKISFYCVLDPMNVNSYSGVPYHMWKALEKHPHFDCDILKRPSIGVYYDFNIVLTSSNSVNYIASKIKNLIYITDSTPSFLEEYFGSTQRAEKIAIENPVVQAATRLVFASDQIIDYAARDFGERIRAKTWVIPWGLNLESPPTRPQSRTLSGPLNLLFVGRDWMRKGGPVALDILDDLRARGIDARLTVVGCKPPEAVAHDFVRTYRFLNKQHWYDNFRYRRLFRQAHLFLLPTTGDCNPMVVAEANAFSLPVLISDVGGIPTILKQGRNGFMFPAEADPTHYADKIEALVTDPNTYAALATSSYDHYRDTLNWDVWADRLYDLLSALNDHRP